MTYTILTHYADRKCGLKECVNHRKLLNAYVVRNSATQLNTDVVIPIVLAVVKIT